MQTLRKLIIFYSKWSVPDCGRGHSWRFQLLKFGETNFFWTFRSLVGVPSLGLRGGRSPRQETASLRLIPTEAPAGLPAECAGQTSTSSFPEEGETRPKSTFLVPTGQTAPLYLIHQVGRPACVHTQALTLTPPRCKCLHNEQGGGSSSKLLIMFPFGLSKDTS